MMLKKWFLLLMSTTFMLAACQSTVYNQTEANVADVVLKAKAARLKSDADARQSPALIVRKGLYVDTTPISLARKPAWLKNHIVIRGDQLPFSYYSRTIGAGAINNVLTKYQAGLDPSVKVSLNYSGTVRGALNLLASKTGYVYSINKDTIYWQAFITKTFDVAFMPGGTDYLMGKSSGGNSQTASTASQGSSAQVSNYVSSDSSDDEYSNLKGTLSIWKDLTATLNQLISPEGKVMVSEATTTITVHDRPTNVNLIGQYIHNLNGNLSKQVLVKIQILDVVLENSWNQGIDWQLVAKSFHNSAFIINGNYGTPITISRVLSPQSSVPSIPASIPGNTPPVLYPVMGSIARNTEIPSYTILLNALSQQAKTSVVSEPRVLCLNNQVSVVRITQQQGYVASIQNTSLAGASTSISNNTVTSQVTPGTVITGLTLYILPKILRGKVYMQVNADLSTNNGFDVFPGSGIQLPNITTKHFNQRSMINSGDTLILSGFKQTSNTANANQFLSSQALGGQGSQMLNRETVVLITPIVLT